MKASGLVIGIDATNLRRGGGVTHLVELLAAANPEKYGIDKVLVWSGQKTLAALEDREWLEKINPSDLDKGLLRRTIWQRFKLASVARAAGCNVLFAPGGSYSANFHPVVTMSQNLLPFVWRELRRYGWSFLTLKLLLLRWVQSQTFLRADGVIFLTEYARQGVLRVTGPLTAETPIIPHGLNSRFQMAPKAQLSISEYNYTKPYRILYVSIIDRYKHQWHVVEAVAALRKLGLPIALDLVGPAYPPALLQLNETIARVDAERYWAHYHGAIPYSELHEMYAKVDMGIWASTCETFGIILLEKMAAGLPIACSRNEPMPEIVGDTGLYFDPEQPNDILRALRQLIESPQLRTQLAQASHRRAQQFSWQRCADETFGFLVEMARQYKAKND